MLSWRALDPWWTRLHLLPSYKGICGGLPCALTRICSVQPHPTDTDSPTTTCSLPTNTLGLYWRRGVGPRPPSPGWRQQQQRQQAPSPARQPNREAEVLSGRWAMVFVAALVAPDLLGAPLVLLPDLLHSRELLVACLAIFGAIGGLEAYRAAALKEETDWERRVYPGRAPLKQRVAELRRSLRRMSTAWQRQQLEEEEEEEGLATSASNGSSGGRGGYAAAPGLGVWSAWLGGLPGWLSGGWWLEMREALSEGELEGLKSSELWMGRLAT